MGSFGFHCSSCDLPILSEGPDKHDYCFKCEEPFSTNENGGGCVSESHLLTLDGSNFHVYETDKTIEKSDKIWIFLYVAISC